MHFNRSEHQEQLPSVCMPRRAFSNCESLAKVISSTTTYYDLPLIGDVPGFERKIYDYLMSHDVHMSHPSMKKLTLPVRINSLKKPGAESCLITKRKSGIRSSCLKVAGLSIVIPMKAVEIE